MENIEKAPNVPPFVRYCAMLVPTVFDDSLSYYEALCALSNWVQNNLVEVVNNNAEVTEEYIQLTNELKDYVEHYFDNLDVQEEIDAKLDEMVENGSLQELVNNYFAYIDEKIENVNLNLSTRLNDQDTEIADLTTNVTTQLNQQDGAIQTLESRMDTFSSLTEGSTTGDAELIDGRIAFDGRTFSTIGDNIRKYQNAGYTDITASLTSTSGYMSKTGTVQSSTGYTYYTMPTDKNKMYLIDCIAQDTAPQVVYGRGSASLYYSIPETIASGNSYNKPVIIKGTGGTVYINNLNSNTHFYVGELDIELEASDISKYFKDITADCILTSGKYRTKTGSESSTSAFNYYTISNPVVGKIYRVFTSSATNAPIAVQRNGMCYPQDVASIPSTIVPTYYDIYCTSDNDMYINTYINGMIGASVKIYESVFTYTTPLQQDIKATVGATETAVFIGDSLTRGQTYTGANTSYNNFYNYPHFMKKLMQIDNTIELARSGATAQTWWNEFNTQINQNNAFYFIWLGTNDVYTDTVSTDCAGDDYTQFADTATGYLGRVVGKVASMTNVKIIIMNNFATVGTLATNNKVINDIATKYNALVVDMSASDASNTGYHTSYTGYYNSVHFNNQGYNYVANYINNALNNYMNSHKAQFEVYKNQS